MANYDTSIRIDAKINTKSAEVRLERLENRMVKTSDTIAALSKKMNALKDVKMPTQEYKEIQNQTESTKKKIADLLAQQERFLATGGKTSSSVYKKTEYDLEELRNSLPYLEGELQDLVDTGKAFVLGQDTKEFANIGKQLTYAKNELVAMEHQHKVLEQKIQKVSDGYKKIGDIAKKAFSSVGNMLKKANSYIDTFTKRIKEVAQKHLPFFRKELEGTKSSLSEFGARLKSFALSLLTFSQIGKIMKSAMSGVKEGFENLYNEKERFKNSVEGVKASLLTLKNAFAGAFSPIVEIAIPYIQELIGWLTEAANLIGQFIAALTGQKTYIRAIKQTTVATEEASGAAKEEADAIEDETDAMNKQLNPLDKLNNLSSENIKKKVDKENISDDNGNVGAGGIMFEEVPITNSILDMAEKVKDILKNLFEPLKKAWDIEGKFVMDSWKYALNEIWDLVKSIGSDFLEVWQQDKTVKIFENLLHIVGDIGLIVGNLAHNFRLAWEENETGKKILEGIRDIIGVIIENIRHAVDVTVEWSKNLDFSPLLTKAQEWIESFIPVIDALSGIMTDFYENVILPLGKWVLEKGLPDLLQVFIDFNNKVDWEALRKRLSDFWEHLEPFAETVGEGLIIFIDKCASALADFMNSPEFDSFLTSIENWMDSVTPEDVADGIIKLAEALIGLKVALLGFSAISAITGVLTTVKTFLSFFGVGGGAVGVSGTMLGTAEAAGGLSVALGFLGQALAIVAAAVVGWNVGSWIAEKLELDPKPFGETMEGIKSSFTDGSWKAALELWGQDIHNAFITLGERIAERWELIKSTISEKLSEIKLWISEKLGSIKEIWNNAWSSMKEKVSSVIQTIKSVIGSAVSWISSQINAIKSAISGLSGAARSMTSGGLGSAMGGALRGGRTTTYSMSPSVNAAMAGLSKIEFPGYATGQVIPRTMRQHLAILGDNNRETEVVSPLSTIEQAVRNAIGGAQPQEINLNLTVECEGHQLLQIMQKLDGEYFKQTGKHAFA